MFLLQNYSNRIFNLILSHLSIGIYFILTISVDYLFHILKIFLLRNEKFLFDYLVCNFYFSYFFSLMSFIILDVVEPFKDSRNYFFYLQKNNHKPILCVVAALFSRWFIDLLILIIHKRSLCTMKIEHGNIYGPSTEIILYFFVSGRSLWKWYVSLSFLQFYLLPAVLYLVFKCIISKHLAFIHEFYHIGWFLEIFSC